MYKFLGWYLLFCCALSEFFCVILLCIVTVAVGPVSVSYYFWEKQQNEYVFSQVASPFGL
jgi:uncharacterized membrane protein HdeD (DUF308 family)